MADTPTESKSKPEPEAPKPTPQPKAAPSDFSIKKVGEHTYIKHGNYTVVL